MNDFKETVIYRHRKENLKKCSLRGLESRDDFIFYTYPVSILPNLSGYVMLTMDAPLLSRADSQKGLFAIDATWYKAAKMEKSLREQDRIEEIELRSLPCGFKTAYPRRQEDCIDPERGLATVEAIYIALKLMGRSTQGLLDNYYWKENFLHINQDLWKELDRIEGGIDGNN